MYTYYWFSRYDYSYRSAYTYYVKNLYTCVEARGGFNPEEKGNCQEGGFTYQRILGWPQLGQEGFLQGYIIYRPLIGSGLHDARTGYLTNYTYSYGEDGDDYKDKGTGSYINTDKLDYSLTRGGRNTIYAFTVPRVYVQGYTKVMVFDYYLNLYIYETVSGYTTSSYTYYTTYWGASYGTQVAYYSRIYSGGGYTYYNGRSYSSGNLYS